MLDEALRQPVTRPARATHGPRIPPDGADLARQALLGGRMVQQGTPIDQVADWLVRLADADDLALRRACKRLAVQARTAPADDAVHPALTAAHLAESRAAWADPAPPAFR